MIIYLMIKDFESKIYKKLKKANQVQYQMSKMTKRYELLREFLKNVFNFFFILFFYISTHGFSV